MVGGSPLVSAAQEQVFEKLGRDEHLWRLYRLAEQFQKMYNAGAVNEPRAPAGDGAEAGSDARNRVHPAASRCGAGNIHLGACRRSHGIVHVACGMLVFVPSKC